MLRVSLRKKREKTVPVGGNSWCSGTAQGHNCVWKGGKGGPSDWGVMRGREGRQGGRDGWINTEREIDR